MMSEQFAQFEKAVLRVAILNSYRSLCGKIQLFGHDAIKSGF
jgi:hypothetical protein